MALCPSPRVLELPPSPDDLPPGPRVLGLLDREEWTAAAAAARAWAEKAPLDAAARYCLGKALEQVAETEAIGAFRQAVYLDPGFALAHFHLATLYQRLGQRDLAERHRRATLAALAGIAKDAALPCGQGFTARDLAAVMAAPVGAGQ